MNRPERQGAGAPFFTSLFAASAAAALASVFANFALLALTTGQGRLRELALFRILRRTLERFDVDFLEIFPAGLQYPYDLAVAGDAVAFLGQAALVNLLLAWLLLLPLAPLLAALVVKASADPRRSVLWSRAIPLGVLILFSVPVLDAVIRHVTRDLSTGPTLILAFGVAVLVWLALLALLRSVAAVRRFVFALAVVTGAAAAVAAASGAAVAVVRAVSKDQRPLPATEGLPNILLVSIDSLRADHLHSYGYPRETSPEMDRLAREGVRFETVLAPTSWTLPSHVTLLTGLPPARHGVSTDSTRLLPDATTLPETLWEAGYSTAGFVSGPYLDAWYGFSQGFDHYDDYTVSKPSIRFAHRGATSPKLLDVVGRWLDGWDAEGRRRPFFVFLHMWDVHYDFTPPPPYDTMFDPDYGGEITGEDFHAGEQYHPGMDPRDLEHVIALYDGEIRYTDLYLGRLFERLEALGVYDRTLVVVTSDHGDEFFEHGERGHHHNLYETSLRVPLLMRYPGKIPPGRTVEPQVRLMDVAPTILALAGLQRPPGLVVGPGVEGFAAVDLTPLIVRGSGNPLPPLPAVGDLEGELASLRTGRFKFIAGRPNGSDDAELYDLETDPAEQVNLMGRDDAREAELRSMLDAWRMGWEDGTDLSRRIRVDEEHEAELRALGYIE